MVLALLSVMVLAGGVVMFNNYRKMKNMEAVIASVLPEKIMGSDEISCSLIHRLYIKISISKIRIATLCRKRKLPV